MHWNPGGQSPSVTRVISSSFQFAFLTSQQPCFLDSKQQICCLTHSPTNPNHSAFRQDHQCQQGIGVPLCKVWVRGNNSSTWKQKASQGLHYHGTKLFDMWRMEEHKTTIKIIPLFKMTIFLSEWPVLMLFGVPPNSYINDFLNSLIIHVQRKKKKFINILIIIFQEQKVPFLSEQPSKPSKHLLKSNCPSWLQFFH